MESDSVSPAAPVATTEAVPVKITPSLEDAPPTLAEPASGPVAEMSGAVQGSVGVEAPKTFDDPTGTPQSLSSPPTIARRY